MGIEIARLCHNKGKSMAEFPALPLFTDAYIADTAHLTNEEHGVYLRLLMFAWRTEACSLPDNDARLALMVGVTKGKWNKLKPTIMSFWRLSNGEWTQKKLTKQRDFVSKQREQKRIAGNASAKARALKSLDTDATAVEPPLPTAPQQPKPITKPITTDKKDTNISTKNNKSKIPDNWVLSDDDHAYAVSKNIKHESIEELANEFQAYWYDRNDRDSKKSQRGWSQCWQSHVRRAANRPEYRNVVSTQKTFGYGQGGGIADIAAQRRSRG